MKELYRKQTPVVKMMLVLVVIAIIGIILRWNFIKKEVSKDIKDRFQIEQTDSI